MYTVLLFSSKKRTLARYTCKMDKEEASSDYSLLEIQLLEVRYESIKKCWSDYSTNQRNQGLNRKFFETLHPFLFLDIGKERLYRSVCIMQHRSEGSRDMRSFEITLRETRAQIACAL